MYTGTMIEELISRVEQAEAHAAGTSDQTSLLPVPVELLATRSHDFTHDYEELLGVA